MKRTVRLLSLILMMIMMLPYGCFAEAAGAEEFGVTGSVTESMTDDQENSVDAEPDSETPAEQTEEQTETDVIYTESPIELSKELDTEAEEPFFTINAKDDAVEDLLATEEITADIDDILSGDDSNSEKQEAIIESLEESGFYTAEEGSGSEVEVTSTYAYKTLMLDAEYVPDLNEPETFGAVKVVFYSDYFYLTYESEEAAKEAYDAFCDLYGEESVMPDLPLHASDTTDTARGWGTAVMGMDYHKTTASHYTVTVAVIDTGITKSHSIFSGKSIVNVRNYVKTEDGSDSNGHGTGVAGIIAESTSDNVRIMPLKVLDYKGNGDIANMIAAIDYAEEKGADIVNMSLGVNTRSTATLNYYEKLFSKRNYKALLICASGNDGMNLDNSGVHYFPAELSSTVCVGAIGAANKQASHCSFSNYGKATDFVAPGDDVITANSKGGYSICDGTSFACPYVTAAAALIMSETKGLKKSTVISRLRNLSVDLGDQGKDVLYGYGCPVFLRDNKDWSSVDLGNDLLFIAGAGTHTYNGSEITLKTRIISNAQLLRENVDYTVNYRNNIYPGNAEFDLHSIEGRTTGSRTGLKFKIKKASNTLKVTAKTASIKRSKVKKKAGKIDVSKVLTVSDNIGSLSYKKTSGSGKLSINSSTGKVTVKKKTKKGTYKMKVKVTASGDSNHSSGSKTVTIKVKVK